MKTSLVQGKAPSRAAINAAEVSSCLLIINASSSRERLHAAKPASICIRLLEQWLLIMAGREDCLRWREASMSCIVSRKVWKPSFCLKIISKNEYFDSTFLCHIYTSSSEWCRLCCTAVLKDFRCIRSQVWHACAQRPPVLLKNSVQMYFEMKGELSMVFLHGLCELELNMHWT